MSFLKPLVDRLRPRDTVQVLLKKDGKPVAAAYADDKVKHATTPEKPDVRPHR